jgi:hypothetical protein
MTATKIATAFKTALKLEYAGNDGGLYLAAVCSYEELVDIEKAIPDQAGGGLPTARYIVSNARVYKGAQDNYRIARAR